MTAKKPKEQLPTIAERNKAYKAMTTRQKAVAVAMDVISQIKAKKYTPENLTYFKFEKQISYLHCNITKEVDTSLQVALETEPCQVCAIGATFASCVRLGNSARTSGIIGASNPAKYMFTHTRAAFTSREMRAMEIVFEYTEVLELTNFFGQTDIERLVTYRNSITEKYMSIKRGWISAVVPEPAALLIGIMNNVIANDGLFLVEGVDFKNLDK